MEEQSISTPDHLNTQLVYTVEQSSKMIKPMLGIACDLEKLQFPLYASPKLDGIRALVTENGLCSRNGKLIPNDFVRNLCDNLPIGLDGELIVGSPTAKDVFRVTSSGIMSKDKTPDFYYHVFDNFAVSGSFIDRFNSITSHNDYVHVKRVEQKAIVDMKALLAFEEACLKQGYEGAMLRYPNAPYKFGRSTVREGALLKLKRFSDSEAEVLAVEPLYTNLNEATKDALGRTARSSHQENKHAQERLGSLLVRDIHTGVEFSVGSGFDDELRDELWNNNPIGKIIKYKFFPVGQKDKPRFPIFLGFRDAQDIS